MTTFGAPQAQPGNFSVAFKQNRGLNEAQLSQDAGEAVLLCRQMLTRARSCLEGNLNADYVNKLAKRYFNLSDIEFLGEKTRIIRKISYLEAGLARDFLLKITPRVVVNGQEEDGVNGKVPFKSLPSKDGKAFPREHKMRLSPTDYGDQGMKSRKAAAYAGSIHLRAGLFRDNRQAALVIIHEACHKFLGFHDGRKDAWYFGESGKEKIELGTAIKYKSSFELLRNADSLAWFIVKLAGKMDKMDGIAVNPRKVPNMSDDDEGTVLLAMIEQEDRRRNEGANCWPCVLF